MPVKKDEDGNRYVEAEAEVPGSPEEVWEAIATADGISSWFMQTTSESDADGTPRKMITSFGPGMDAVAEVTEWHPPHYFIAESEEGAEPGEGPGKVATEWIVEARAGGTCVVRVVHRWFADSDDWDGQFEGHAYGWATSFFRTLQLYLTHFAGQKCAPFALTAFSPTTGPETWRILKDGLKIDEASGGFASASGTPELAGAVEHMEITDPELLSVRERSPQVKAALEGMDGEEPELLLRLDRPAPGLAHLFIMPMGEQTMVSARFFFYGDQAASVAADAEREWNSWLAEKFPQEATG